MFRGVVSLSSVDYVYVLAGAQGEHKVGHSGKFGKGRQQIINKQAINNCFGSAHKGEHKVGHAGKFGKGSQ